MSEDQLRAEIERLRAENEHLKGQRSSRTTLKVSDKGGVSVYGLGRFPVTLYKEQWAKLLDMANEIRAFIKEHEAEPKTRSSGHSPTPVSSPSLGCPDGAPNGLSAGRPGRARLRVTVARPACNSRGRAGLDATGALRVSRPPRARAGSAH